MRTDEANIDSLERAILSEANAEVEQIRQNAKAKADAILARAQEQAGSERKAIVEKARQEAERVRSQYVATSQLKARTLELERREKLLNDVFTSARAQLTSIQKEKNYEDVVEKLLREAVSQLNADKVTVSADAVTQKILEKSVNAKVSKALKIEIKVAKTLEEGVGLIVEAADGRLKYDNTLENRLSRIQNELRSPVYQLLMGEAR